MNIMLISTGLQSCDWEPKFIRKHELDWGLFLHKLLYRLMSFTNYSSRPLLAIRNYCRFKAYGYVHLKAQCRINKHYFHYWIMQSYCRVQEWSPDCTLYKSHRGEEQWRCERHNVTWCCWTWVDPLVGADRWTQGPNCCHSQGCCTWGGKHRRGH